LAAELAHWQDRDRNQKINAMAQMASTKLRAWVDEGPYAKLFDRPTTIQLDNPWLYFNVEKLKDDPRLGTGDEPVDCAYGHAPGFGLDRAAKHRAAR
jgi:hypothetical protein